VVRGTGILCRPRPPRARQAEPLASACHGRAALISFMRMYGSNWAARLVKTRVARVAAPGCALRPRWPAACRRRRRAQAAAAPPAAAARWPGRVDGAGRVGAGQRRPTATSSATPAFVVTPAGVVVVDALGSPALARGAARRPSRASRRCRCARDRHALPRRPHLRPAGVQGAGARSRRTRRAAAYLHSDTAALRLRPAARSWRPGSTTTRGWCRPTAGSTGRLHAGRAAEFVLQPVPARRTRPKTWWWRCRSSACCSPATWCSAAASPLSARPTAAAGSRRWTAAGAEVRDHRARPRPGVEPRAAKTCSSRATTCSTCARRWARRRATSSPSKRPTPRPTGRASSTCRCSSAANRINAYNTYLLMEQRPAGQMKRRPLQRRRLLAAAPLLAPARACRPRRPSAPARPWPGPAVTLLDGRRWARRTGRGGGGGGVLVDHLPVLPPPQPAHREAAPRRAPAGPCRCRCWAWRATATPRPCAATPAAQGYSFDITQDVAPRWRRRWPRAT
jgi:hypothetical protein